MSLLRKTLRLFDRTERRGLVFLVVTVVLRAAAEAVGVVSVVPFLALAANPKVVDTSRKLHAVYVALHFTSPRAFLIFTGAAMLAVTIVSNGLSAFALWYMLRFVWQKNHTLTTQMLERYLAEPYTFFLHQNTSNFAKNVLNEVGSFTNGVLTPLTNVIANVAVVVFILIILVVLNPLLALVTLVVFAGAYAVVYGLVRGRQDRLGRVRLEMNRRRFQIATEGFGGFKDLKVSGREGFFIERFEEPSLLHTRAIVSNQVIGQMPKYAMQSIAYGGIITVVLLLLSTGRSITALLPTLGLYAIAAYRLMPSLQAVFTGVVTIRFNAPALNVIAEELARGKQLVAAARRQRVEAAPVSFIHEFTLENVVFQYERAPTAALHGVSLRVRKNSTIGLIGPTGAGKTTLVDVILGLLPATEGSLRVDGTPVTQRNLRKWQDLLGYVPQHIYLSDSTIRSNIAFGVPEAEIDEDRVRRAARIANLDSFVRELPRGYDTTVGERGIRLSGGQRQRIGIARALYSEPDVLILDEATSSLDGMTENVVMEAIGSLARQKTIILIAHRLTTVRDCDVIYLMEAGRITSCGTYDELLRDNATVQSMARLAAVERTRDMSETLGSDEVDDRGAAAVMEEG